MTAYDEIEIEDMEWNEELRAFTFACPCGDVFQITKVRARVRERDATRRRKKEQLLFVSKRQNIF